VVFGTITGVGIAAGQFGVIALNAESRQIGQTSELAPYLNVTDQTVALQWRLLLLLFVIGVIVSMLRRAIVENRQPSGQPTPDTTPGDA